MTNDDVRQIVYDLLAPLRGDIQNLRDDVQEIKDNGRYDKRETTQNFWNLNQQTKEWLFAIIIAILGAVASGHLTFK